MKKPVTKKTAKVNTLFCGYKGCGVKLPGPYGTPGVSLSRADNKTLLCSNCGTREALENYLGR